MPQKKHPLLPSQTSTTNDLDTSENKKQEANFTFVPKVAQQMLMKFGSKSRPLTWFLVC